MEKAAVVGYSFGYRLDRSGQKRPGPTNLALAQEVEKLCHKIGNGLVVLQWEIADCIEGFKPDLVVREHRLVGKYLDSEEVTAQAAAFLKQHNINQVWLVAHSWLHRAKCQQLLRSCGFQVLIPAIGRIPYDQQSAQWWTHSPFKALGYAILQSLTGRQGR